MKKHVTRHKINVKKEYCHEKDSATVNEKRQQGINFCRRWETGKGENVKELVALSLSLALATVLSFATFAFAISTGYTGETAATAGTGINGTVHDLRRHNTHLAYQSSQNDDLDRLCIFCHAPHHAYRLSTAGAAGTGAIAPANYTYLPLWNHTVTTLEFVPYYNGSAEPQDGPKRSQAIDQNMQIGGSSLLCLSCHDGTVAVNVYGYTPQDTGSISNGSTDISSEYSIGNQGYLANHHPIGFDYDAVAAVDPEIYNANAAVFDHSADPNISMADAPAEPIANFLQDGKMACSTCHAVHNKGNTGEKLLYVSDQGSNLCLSCHIKGAKTYTGVTQ
jgi:predicted CXXCH cytochrome family protein